MTKIKGEEVPNAILGAILGVGIAAKNDLSEMPENLAAAFLEIAVFVCLVLGLTMLVRQGAFRIAEGKYKSGAAAILVPVIALVTFSVDRAEFITYGDVIVLSVMGVWWLVYLLIGILDRMQSTRT